MFAERRRGWVGPSPAGNAVLAADPDSFAVTGAASFAVTVAADPATFAVSGSAGFNITRIDWAAYDEEFLLMVV